MNWIAKIEKVSNGYILELDNRDNDLDIMHSMVLEEKESYTEHDERRIELETFISLVWEIAEFFAIHNSKHKSHNLEIGVREEETKTP